MKGYFNFHTNPPPEGVIVQITGNYKFGYWVIPVKRKNFEPNPKNHSRYFQDGSVCWRWVYAFGFLKDEPVEYKDDSVWWRPLAKQNIAAVEANKNPTPYLRLSQAEWQEISQQFVGMDFNIALNAYTEAIMDELERRNRI